MKTTLETTCQSFLSKLVKMCVWIGWTNLIAIGICYFLINIYQFGNEKSYHLFHVDVAFFKSHVFSLQQKYQLFPKSLENLREHYKYHYFDAHVKYWLAKLFGVNGAFLFFSLASFLTIVFLVVNKPEYLISVPLIFFSDKLEGFPFFFRLQFFNSKFVFDSDFIHNHNDILGLIILLLWVRSRSSYVRYSAAFLVGFVEMTLAPTLSGLLILDYALYRKKLTEKIITLMFIIFSYYTFKGEIGSKIFFSLPDFSRIYYGYIDAWWYIIIVSVYYLYLKSKSGRKQWLDTIILLTMFLLPLFFQAFKVLATPIKYNYGDSWQINFWIYAGVAIYILKQIDISKIRLPILPSVFMPIMILSILYFGTMSMALTRHEFGRMSEYFNNQELIQATTKIKNDGVVGLNFIDHPLHKNRQLQVTGIIPNQLFVSNLIYGKSSAETKAQLYKDWEDIKNFLKTGQPDLSSILTYLLIQKPKHNYRREVIEQHYQLINETDNYLVYKRKSVI